MPLNSIQTRFQKDGFVYPLTAMSAKQSDEYRKMLEEIESQHSSNPELHYAFNGYANLVLPFVDEITLRGEILDSVEALIGPNIIVFSASLFIKEANTNKFISWHQDLRYWGLSGENEVTAWVALSPATIESGCMRMVRGSHLDKLVEHKDTFHEDNLLTRGQAVAVEIDESAAVNIELQPGEFSLHHGYTFHGSHANLSNDRRIGMSINYISTDMQIRNGARPIARMGRGVDNYGHFELIDPPKSVLDPKDVETLHRAKKIGETFFYAGTDRRLATDDI
jgi:non-haem Fe2+, alpha-ketoglutarate-dependent halogenase